MDDGVRALEVGTQSVVAGDVDFGDSVERAGADVEEDGVKLIAEVFGRYPTMPLPPVRMMSMFRV